MQTANAAHDYYQKAKNSIVENAPKNPNEVLDFMRHIAKQYAGIVPGAPKIVDNTFDALDHLHETHGAEFDKIMQATYDDIMKILKEVQDKGLQGIDAATAGKLMSIVTKRVAELNGLGKKVGGDAFEKFEKKYPQIARTLGTSWGELTRLAEHSGPETKKLVDDTVKQVQDIMNKSKDTPDAVNHAKEVVQQKAQQVKEMVWSTAEKEVESNPELKDLLKENKQAFIAAGSDLGSLSEVIEHIREVTKGGTDEGKIKELKAFLKSKAEGTQSQGWDGLKSWVKSMPGGEEVRTFLTILCM